MKTFKEYQLENIIYSQELIPWAQEQYSNCVGLVPLVQLNVNGQLKIG